MYRRESKEDKVRIREEVELHEQGDAETAVGTEGTCTPSEEPITVRETAEEVTAGSY